MALTAAGSDLKIPQTGELCAPASCVGTCASEPDFDRLIDLARLQELLDEIGSEDLSVIVDLFLEETDAIISRIANAAAGPELAADLHFLKGCALNLGLAALAGLCRDAERCNACGRAVPLEPGMFTTVYDASKLAFRVALEGDGP